MKSLRLVRRIHDPASIHQGDVRDTILVFDKSSVVLGDLDTSSSLVASDISVLASDVSAGIIELHVVPVMSDVVLLRRRTALPVANCQADKRVENFAKLYVLE